MNKEQRKFIIFAIATVIFSFVVSFGYYKYQDYKREKELEKFKNIFSFEIDKKNVKNKNLFTKLKDSIFGSKEEKLQKEIDKKFEELLNLEEKFNYSEDKNKKTEYSNKYKKISEEIIKLQDKYLSLTGTNYETIIKDELTKIENNKIQQKELSAEEIFKNNLKKQYLDEGYILKENSIFEKVKTFFGSDIVENFTKKDGNTVEIKYGETNIITKEKINEELIKISEYTTEDNYRTIKVKIDFIKNGFIRKLDDVNNGFGVDEFKDGSRIEFKHKNQIPVGPAVKYYASGDREEFRYNNGQRHGFSTYYFTNGDKEEVYYMNGVLEGKARYIYADGYVEIYKYKNGQRVE